ncbi:MAG TPA: YihY/virulence factor BrkB family protein [Candidatus Saccharimonadales bacterium]|nr:YihY/virulence factor BrkB family protein [Candidatus Saccharimonadales bacterium]
MDIEKPLRPLDKWQQKHPWVGFPLAVLKKYGDDQGGYLAALLTYYGFLSLFPLFLVLVTVLQLWFRGDPTFQNEVSANVGHFFPVLGAQLQGQIHGIRKAGLGLTVGILISLYGARGVASAFRSSLNTVWRVPKEQRVGFPLNLLHDIAIMAAGAAGFAATVAVSAFSAQLGHAFWVKILVNVLGFGILALVIAYIFRIGTSGRIGRRHMVGVALLAAVIIQTVLTFGTIIMRRELGRLDSLYGTFAVVLGLLFWIYLFSQVIIFCAEVSTVRKLRLYPQPLLGEPPKKK